MEGNASVVDGESVAGELKERNWSKTAHNTRTYAFTGLAVGLMRALARSSNSLNNNVWSCASDVQLYISD